MKSQKILDISPFFHDENADLSYKESVVDTHGLTSQTYEIHTMFLHLLEAKHKDKNSTFI
jgi:hypothetical protein